MRSNAKQQTILALLRRWAIVPLSGILAGLIALAFSFFMPLAFTASAQIMTPQGQQSGASALLGSLGGLSAAAGMALPGLKNPADQWVGLLKSRTVADALVNRFDLVSRYKSRFRFEARDTLASKTTISAGKDGLIDIAVTDNDPQIAADIANAYIKELQDLTKGLAVTEAAQRRLFFQNQLEETKNKLAESEANLRNAGVNARELNTNPNAALEGVARLKAQITSLQIELSVMSETMTANNPDVIRSRRELAALQAQMDSLNKTSDQTSKSNDHSNYTSKFRDFKYYETMFEIIARQYEIAKSDEAKDGAVIQVVDPAEVPEWKSSPKRGIISVGAAIFGMAAACVYILIASKGRRSQLNANFP